MINNDEYYYDTYYDESGEDSYVPNVENVEKGSDELLIDAIRGYPHLYNSSLKDYKDVNMKENSWKEISKIMNMPIDRCQNRWLRLRERFSKEQRFREIETRSGSGATHRATFPLYNNLLFLANHVKRRRAYTNVINPIKKPLIDTSNISCSDSININTRNNSLHQTVLEKSFSNSISSIAAISNKENNIYEVENITETDRILSPSSSQSECEFDNFSATRKRTLTSTESTTSPVKMLPANKKIAHSGRVKKSNSYLEHSLTALSDSLQKRLIDQPHQQIAWNLNDITPDNTFGLLVATELGRISEPEKSQRKQAIANIL